MLLRTVVGIVGVTVTMVVVWRVFWVPRKGTLREPVPAAAAG